MGCLINTLYMLYKTAMPNTDYRVSVVQHISLHAYLRESAIDCFIKTIFFKLKYLASMASL